MPAAQGEPEITLAGPAEEHPPEHVPLREQHISARLSQPAHTHHPLPVSKAAASRM